MLLAALIVVSLTGCDQKEGIPSAADLAGDGHVDVGGGPTDNDTSDGVSETSDDASDDASDDSVNPTCLESAGYGTVTLRITTSEGSYDQVWLDRNLGASEVATQDDLNDSTTFGYAFQWGRGLDGHQERDSSKTDGSPAETATSIKLDPNDSWYGKFIMHQPDWLTDDASTDLSRLQRQEAWGDENNETQVCPCGYVVPSNQDFDNLQRGTENGFTQLNLPYVGYRSPSNLVESYVDVGSKGYYWTRDFQNDPYRNKYYFFFTSDERNTAGNSSSSASSGYAVRCIRKDTSVATPIN